jgi:AraC-like DNA-binding protein
MCLGKKSQTPRQLTAADLADVTAAKNSIDEHLRGDVTISSLARAVYVSQTKLKRNFRAVFGKTIRRYVMESRMDAASRFLLKTDDAISRIASRVGYKTASAFTAAFKRYTGQLPGDFRQRVPPPQTETRSKGAFGC